MVPGRRLWVTGHVQGVGFRPFVYRLALRHGLTGWVRNTIGEVEILIQGEKPALETFTAEIMRNLLANRLDRDFQPKSLITH